MKKNNRSIKLFENPLLERLTHVHPITPIILFSAIIGYFSWGALKHLGVMNYLITFLVGIVLWTLIEYVIHRFIYHLETRTQKGKDFVFLMHGIHHRSPRDSTRLVSPPVVSVIASAIILVMYQFLFGHYYEGFFAGTMLGYLVYDLIHFSVHHFNGKQLFFRYLKEYHFSHHYSDGAKAFGVSSPLWDFVFKTMPVKPKRH